MRVPCFPLSKELLFFTYCSILNITDLQNVSKSSVLSFLKKKNISFSTFVWVRSCTPQSFTHMSALARARTHTHTIWERTNNIFPLTEEWSMVLTVHDAIVSTTLCISKFFKIFYLQREIKETGNLSSTVLALII